MRIAGDVVITAVIDADPDDRPVETPPERLGGAGLLVRVAGNRAVQAGVIAIAALALRLVALRTSFDIFIDEVTYTRIGVNLAGGKGLTLDRLPFNLHPPAMMAVMAGVINVFGLHGDLEHQVLALRPVAAVFGAVACAGAYLLVERASSRRHGVMVAALVALNPFVILYDSEVMLEAMAQAAAVALFCILAAAVRSRSQTALRRYTVSAGLCGAVVVCTKETFGLVAVGALLVLLGTGWVLPRRHIATTLAVTVAGYVSYVMAIGFTEGFTPWWDAKTSGIRRLVGADQQTGFNAPGTHVSLLSRVFAHGAIDGITYALLVLGGLASLALIWQLRPWTAGWRLAASTRQRAGLLVAVWAVLASGYLTYATFIGSLEEQMFYIMVLPTTAALCVWAAWRAPSWRPNWRTLAASLLVVALVGQGVVWGVVHTRRDDTYQQFLAWEPSHVPFMSTISVTEDTAQFLLHEAVLGDWSTMAQLREHHVDYVLLSTALVDQGYGSATKSFQAVLDAGATVVFQANGPTSGSLRLYDVRRLVRSTS